MKQTAYKILFRKAVVESYAYIKERFNVENEFEMNTLLYLLEYIGKKRNVICKILNILYPNDLQSDILTTEDFGKLRSLTYDECMVTPFLNKYNKIINLKNYVEINNYDYLSKDNMPFDNYFKSTLLSMKFKQARVGFVKENNIELNCICYEYDDEFINSLKKEKETTGYTYLAYRSIIHSGATARKYLLNQILISINSKSVNYLRLYWLLCQGTFYHRGSASISEMFLDCIAFLRKEKTNPSSYINYGDDVIAILSNYAEYEKNNFNKFKHLEIIDREDDINSSLDLADIIDNIKNESKIYLKYLANNISEIDKIILNKKEKDIQRSRISSQGYLKDINQIKLELDL